MAMTEPPPLNIRCKVTYGFIHLFSIQLILCRELSASIQPNHVCCLWEETQRKPMLGQREHAHSTQKGPSMPVG